MNPGGKRCGDGGGPQHQAPLGSQQEAWHPHAFFPFFISLISFSLWSTGLKGFFGSCSFFFFLPLFSNSNPLSLLKKL